MYCIVCILVALVSILYYLDALDTVVHLIKLGFQPLYKTGWKTLVKQEGPVIIKPIREEIPFVIDEKKLAKYIAICKLPVMERMGEVPLLFVSAMCINQCMKFLCHPDFPFPLMGIVHVRTKVTQRRILRLDEKMTMVIQVRSETKAVKRGTEIEVEMSLTTNEVVGDKPSANGTQERPWEGVITLLCMHKHPKGKLPETSADQTNTQSESPFSITPNTKSYQWELSESIGRQYGCIAGDFNPIHLHAIPARLLGFKNAIAHGLYTTARVYGDCMRAMEEMGMDIKFPLVSEVAYKRPLFIPGKAELRVSKIEGERRGVEISLVNEEGKLLQDGYLRME